MPAPRAPEEPGAGAIRVGGVNVQTWFSKLEVDEAISHICLHKEKVEPAEEYCKKLQTSRGGESKLT